MTWYVLKYSVKVQTLLIYEMRGLKDLNSNDNNLLHGNNVFIINIYHFKTENEITCKENSP